MSAPQSPAPGVQICARGTRHRRCSAQVLAANDRTDVSKLVSMLHFDIRHNHRHKADPQPHEAHSKPDDAEKCYEQPRSFASKERAGTSAGKV